MKKEQVVVNKTLDDLRIKAKQDLGEHIVITDVSAYPYFHLDCIQFSYVKQNHTVRVNAWQSGDNVIMQQTVIN